MALMMVSTARITQWLALLFALMLPNLADAQQKSDCPKRLGIISNDRLSEHVLDNMLEVYRALGCRVDIIDLPGRRGFIAFNSGQIDGEVLRFPIGAKQYTRPFVRSEVPLLEISNSLWGTAGSKRYSDETIGYTIGIAWQEQYLQATMLPNSGHHDIGDVLLHYNTGTFDRFLAEDSTIRRAIRKRTFTKGREPVQIEVLKVGPVYHYLSDEYAAFMKRFSNYIAKHNPFDGGEIM